MDFFQHRYYRLGKILMSLTGTWPYQRTSVRLGILVVVVLFIGYQIVGQIRAIVQYRNDWNLLLECFVPTTFDALCITKYLAFMCNSRKTLKLLNRMRVDWEICARHRDIKILHEYTERGQKISIMCAVVVYFSTFIYMIQPMIAKLTDVVLNNGTELGKFPFPVMYYHLDVEKYYYYLIMYGAICALILMTAFISSEVMLIIYVHHVCAIFVAVGHKLERFGRNGTSAKTRDVPSALAQTDRVYLASCIERHNNAIEYSNLIKNAYAWNFFFTIAFGMIFLNATGLQVLLRTSDLEERLIFLILSISTLMCFYVECGICQILIDHSISIRCYIYNSKWYRLPLKTQKILQLMIMRCNLPCELTAGDFLIMSVQSFGLTMRAAMSYFAFVRSMQGT